MATNTVLKTLIVDDSATYRRIISSVLSEIPGVNVVGFAENGKHALERIAVLKPDFATVDVEMEVMDGPSLLKELQNIPKPPRCIILSGTTSSNVDSTLSALKLGAYDFVRKPLADDLKENQEQLKKHLLPIISSLQKQSEEKETLNTVRLTSAVPSQLSFPVKAIALGASTGGPSALSKILSNLSPKLSVPLFIVQHMPSEFTTSLAKTLDKHSSLKVVEASDGQPVLHGTVYLAPGGCQMKVEKVDGKVRIRVTNDPPENYCRPSVDYFFRSMATVYGRHCIAAILTGMGDDGALGAKQLKDIGACTIAQDRASSTVYGMPKACVNAGAASFVVELDSIAESLKKLMGRT